MGNESKSLGYLDAVKIAMGCHDYGGGYRDRNSSDIYHHGIQTAIDCLRKNEVYVAMVGGGNMEHSFLDALAMVKGCLNNGGYQEKEQLDIYYHGIQAVINCLERVKESGLNDTQTYVTHMIGSEEYRGMGENHE